VLHSPPVNHSHLTRWAVVLIPTLILFFAPVPGLNEVQRHLLAIFFGTIIALVARPVPMGVSVLVAMTVLALARVLPFARVLAGFSNVTLWLIFTAFLFARAVTATGFGLRIAYLFVAKFGRNALTLAYSIAATDAVLAMFIPSDTARGGGIVFPIVRSLALVFDSEPGPTARRIGAFLVLVGFHSTYTGSAMFLTGMAANPLIAKFAFDIAHVELTWARWALAAAVPGILSLICVPYLLFKLYPPEIHDTEAARVMAREELARMGPMSRNERWLLGILIAVMAGWVSSPWHGIPNTFVALAGLCAILLTQVLTWDELLAENRAWDALIWFAPLLMMADNLQELGVIKVLSSSVFGHLSHLSWMAAMGILVLVYLYIHYAFASMTAHVTALYPAFVTAAVATGAPGLMAALPLAFFSNLNAGLTHYGTGSAPVYFGSGYVTQAVWWRLGFIVSLLNIVLWLGIGPLWWKVLGLW
jgi:divalent anion:Na+ symporter, DASS family